MRGGLAPVGLYADGVGPAAGGGLVAAVGHPAKRKECIWRWFLERPWLWLEEGKKIWRVLIRHRRNIQSSYRGRFHSRRSDSFCRSNLFLSEVSSDYETYNFRVNHFEGQMLKV